MTIGNYGINEENTKGVLGDVGIGVPIEDINMMVGGLFGYEGKTNRLSVPYIDENGILQKPIFGISSFSGKEIKKWSHELYKRILEFKGNISNIPSNGSSALGLNSMDSNKSNSDLKQILKLRLAKGEIIKDEYVELLKLID